MKKSLSYITIATLLTAAPFYALNEKVAEQLSAQPKQVISFLEISPEMMKEFYKGMHPDIVIECKAGVELPVKFFGKFGLFSITYAPDLKFKVEKTCYLRFVKKADDKEEASSFISYDLKTWEKASKIQGEVNAEMGLSVGDAQMTFEAKADQSSVADDSEEFDDEEDFEE